MKCDRKIGPYDCCSVVQGDCLELMKALPDGCVDAVITDPLWPNAPDSVQKQYDVFGIMDRFVRQMNAKRAAIVLGCNSDPRQFLYTIPLPYFRLCWLEYVRPHYLGRLMYTSDVAYLFGEPPSVRKDQFVISGRCTDTSSDGKQADHPFPRKLSHFEWLVRKWSNPDETILDPFLGSGTTAVAAKKLGRHFLGFEISEEYCRIARERIALVEAQPNLFERTEAIRQECLNYNGDDKEGALMGELDALTELDMLKGVTGERDK